MLFKILHSLLARFLLFLLMVIFFIPVTFYLLLPERFRYKSRCFFKMAQLFNWLALKCLFLPIKYRGLENVPHTPVIFAANHQSAMDIPLLGMVAQGTPYVWMAWANLMKGPILRFVLPHVAVLVDTSTPMTAVRSLLQTMELVRKYKLHVMIFPEGGRYDDDQIHSFYGGFVLLARRTQRPVVPVYIHGANKAYPPKTWWMTYHPITVTVGKPFQLEPDESDEQFKDRVRQWFVEQAAEQNAQE
jgi:1-acyl-sn-glycerol-3-phosphate acyltransferase